MKIKKQNSYATFAMLLIFIVALSIIKSAHAETEYEKEDSNKVRYESKREYEKEDSDDRYENEKEDDERYEIEESEDDEYEWDLSDDFESDNIKIEKLNESLLPAESNSSLQVKSEIEAQKAKELEVKAKIEELKKDISQADKMLADVNKTEELIVPETQKTVIPAKKKDIPEESFLHKILKLFGFLGRE
jgi:hypothetical protein